MVVNDRGVSLDGARLESDALASDVVAEISACGGRAIPDHADIRSAADVSTMVNRTVEQFGRVDIAICNAGNMRKLRFSETEETDLASSFGHPRYGNISARQGRVALHDQSALRPHHYDHEVRSGYMDKSMPQHTVARKWRLSA